MIAFEHLLVKRKKAKNHLAASAMYPQMYPSHKMKGNYPIKTYG